MLLLRLGGGPPPAWPGPGPQPFPGPRPWGPRSLRPAGGGSLRRLQRPRGPRSTAGLVGVPLSLGTRRAARPAFHGPLRAPPHSPPALRRIQQGPRQRAADTAALRAHWAESRATAARRKKPPIFPRPRPAVDAGRGGGGALVRCPARTGAPCGPWGRPSECAQSCSTPRAPPPPAPLHSLRNPAAPRAPPTPPHPSAPPQSRRTPPSPRPSNAPRPSMPRAALRPVRAARAIRQAASALCCRA
ncbi:unnamed protein product, partial [Rangifer tarandus platyrhynchus]